VVNEAIFTLIAAVAVVGVMAVPAILAKRIGHGEARFKSENRKQNEDD